MAAFSVASPVRTSDGHVVAGQTSSCPCHRTPIAVLETPQPSSIDELVRSWFSPRGRPGKGKKGDSSDEDAPLTSEISGPLCDTNEATHYLLSTTVVARKDSSAKMKQLLRELSESTRAGDADSGIVQCSVNQSPEDPACFMIFERFAGADAMTKHQKGPVYQKFIRAAQPLLERPLGIHICKEINGKISLAYHPFGPAGEGGRDDMIYGIGSRDMN